MARRQRHRDYDRYRRDPIARAFYHTAAWQRLRAMKLAETPYCEDCMQRDCLVQADHVHHVVELRDDWDLRLDVTNLRSLCHPCHSRHHGHASTFGKA
jgi:5-methylcytosine-specific restriction protein A